MSGARFHFVPVMDHEIHVTEWGTRGAPALLMLHGLARTGRDFDEIAAALSDQYHVLCPDMIGRGLSSWSRNPEAEYAVEYYAGVITDLMDHFGIARTTILGTSLGGMIGMRLASGHDADRIAALIINDISPELPEAAVARILSYVSLLPDFASFTEGETWLRQTYAPFGPASDAFWQRMARSSLRRRGDGRLTLHYDPQITVQFTASPHELTTWDRWNRIAAPTHLLRGSLSDLLLPEAAGRMAETGPRPGLSTFPDCGHAPTLSRPEDIARVHRILAKLRHAA